MHFNDLENYDIEPLFNEVYEAFEKLDRVETLIGQLLVNPRDSLGVLFSETVEEFAHCMRQWRRNLLPALLGNRKRT